jgi:twitching motility protein PilT
MRLVRAGMGCGRVQSVDVMMSSDIFRDYIVNEEKTSLIREAIAAGASQYGMQTFDQSLFHLVQSGMITMEEALHNATNVDEFKMRVSGILSAEQAMTTMRPASEKTPPPVTANRAKEDIFVKH